MRSVLRLCLAHALLRGAELCAFAVDGFVAAGAVLAFFQLLDDRAKVGHLLLGEGEGGDCVAHG